MRRAALCFFVVLSTGAASVENDVNALLPVGRVRVDVMQMTAGPRAAELSAKLQTAMQKDKEWWTRHVQKAQPGQPLPWDARMGLTREEYQEFLRVSREMRLAKAGEAELEFVRSGNGVITLRASEAITELNGIKLDMRADFVETTFGRTNDRSRIAASEEQRATGPWNGVQWKLEAPGSTPGTGTIIKFALGKLKSDGRGILYYDAKDIRSVGSGRKASRVVVFPAGK